MSPQPPRSEHPPALPSRGPGFWVPALMLPLLLLGAAAAVFVLGEGPGSVVLGCALALGAVSSLAFYASGIRRRRSRNGIHNL